jgi:hypothetical protein
MAHEVERLAKDPIILAMVLELRGQVGGRIAQVVQEAFFASIAYDEYLRRGGDKTKLFTKGGPARAIKKILGLS